MKTFDEIRGLLAEKFSKEKKRLKSFGTKANSFDLANAVARYVEALMTSSRVGELERALKKIKKYHWDVETGQVEVYIKERLYDTALMAKAIHNTAVNTENARPWKPKSQRKDKHSKHHKHHKHHGNH